MPDVTVLMSVYNGEPFLSVAIESILEQTFTDFEFLIIDDGSIDGTWAVLQKYAARDARIRLLQNEDNIGLTRSLNKGIEKVQGKYVARQDADDISMPDRFARQKAFMESSPEIGAIGSWAEIIDRDNKLFRIHRSPTNHKELRAHLLAENPLIHTSLFVRLETLRAVGGYDSEVPYAQDYDLWWRLSQITQLAIIPEILVQRRNNTPGGIANSCLNEQRNCVVQIAKSIVHDEIGLKGAALKSYKRLVLALYGQPVRWQTGDTKALEPFWQYLANGRTQQRVWGEITTRLACRILPYHEREAFSLAWVAFQKLRWVRVWPSFLEAWLKSKFVPRN